MISKLPSTQKQIEQIALLLLAVGLLWPFLFLDFWNDELYSLDHFVFVPFAKILTDYHVPNNHIFSNLFLHVWCKFFGLDNIDSVLETPWILRFPMMAISILSVGFLYHAGEKIQRCSGLLSALALLLSIPFLNFALQIRGYGISLFFVCLLLWLLTCSISKFRLLFISLISALLAYTIPSNFYIEIGLIAGGFVGFLFEKNKDWLLKITAIASGIGLSLLFYLPIFSDVFQNEYVQASTPFELHRLVDVTPRVLKDLIGYRFLFLSFGIIGLFSFMRIPKNRTWLMILISVILTPFLVSFVRGDDAPMRSFIVVLPPLVLIFGLSISQLIQQTKRSRIWILIFCLVFVSEGIATIIYTNQLSDKECLFNIQHIKRSQNLVTNFYQHRYQPLVDVQNFATNNNVSEVLVHSCEAHGIPYFLNHFGLTPLPESSLDSMIKMQQPFYVVSSNPFDFIRRIQKEKANARIHFLSENLTYHNFLKVEFDTIEMALINAKITESDVRTVVLFSPSLNGISTNVDSVSIRLFSTLSENPIFELNSLHGDCINQRFWLVEYPYVTNRFSNELKQRSFGKIIQTDTIGNSLLSLIEPYSVKTDSSQQKTALILSEKSKYSPAQKFLLTKENLRKIWNCSAQIRVNRESDLSLVMSIDREGKQIHWQETPIENCENNQPVIRFLEMPDFAQLGDSVSVYIWLKSSGSAQIWNVQIESNSIE